MMKKLLLVLFVISALPHIISASSTLLNASIADNVYKLVTTGACEECILTNIDFSTVKPGANFTIMDKTVNLPVSFVTIKDLSDADLSGSSFSNNINLSSVMFDGARLENVTFSGTNLTNATFEKTISLKGANFYGNLNNNGPVASNLSGVNFYGSNLSGVNLSNVQANGAIFTNVDLTSTNLAKVDLTGANLTGANLTNANLSNVVFQSCIAINANFTGANLTGINGSYGNFTGANFTNAIARSANFENTNFNNAITNGADISYSDFTGATLGNSTGPASTQARNGGVTCTFSIGVNGQVAEAARGMSGNTGGSGAKQGNWYDGTDKGGCIYYCQVPVYNNNVSGYSGPSNC